MTSVDRPADMNSRELIFNAVDSQQDSFRASFEKSRLKVVSSTVAGNRHAAIPMVGNSDKFGDVQTSAYAVLEDGAVDRSSAVIMLDDGDELYADLLQLKDPVSMDNLGRYIQIFMKIIPPCLVSGFSYAGMTILQTLGFLACNRASDPLLTSTLSLSIFLMMLTLLSMNYSSTEKLGLALSQAYASKDFSRYKKYLCQCLLLGAIYWTVFALPLMIFMEHILLALNFLPELAVSIQGFYWKLALTEIIRFAGDILMVIASSQGIETSFFWLLVTNSVLSISFMCFLCFYVGLTLDALVYAAALYHLVNLAIFLKVYLVECDKKSIGLVHFKAVLGDFCKYTTDWLGYFFGIWFEWVSYESTYFFVAMTKDIHQIAAFGSLTNIVYMVCTLQIGFRFGARSRINYLMAKGYIAAAKRCFYLFFIGVICLNILLGVLVYFVKEYIADFYAGNINETRVHLVRILAIYCFAMSADAVFGLLSLVARTIDHVGFGITMNVVFMICLMGMTHYIIVKVLHQTVEWMTLNMYLTFTLVYVLTLLKFAIYDWNKAPILSS